LDDCVDRLQITGIRPPGMKSTLYLQRRHRSLDDKVGVVSRSWWFGVLIFVARKDEENEETQT